MGKHTVVEFRGREASADPLTELLRAGAQQLIYQAVDASYRSCWRSMQSAAQRMGKPAWYATAIYRSASFRPA